MQRLVESLDISRLKDSHGRISQVLLSQTNARPTWFSSSPSISTWSWFFILTYKWPFTNTPENKRKQWLKLEIEKKTDKKFLFHINLTPGTLQRSISPTPRSFHRCSLFQVLVWMCLELHNSTLSHWKNKAQTSQRLSRSPFSSLFFPPPLLSVASFQPSLAFFTLLCCVCVRNTAGGRWWSGWLQGEVALLSTVVLTSTETCQARFLGLGLGQTLQERWVLWRQREKDWCQIGNT